MNHIYIIKNVKYFKLYYQYNKYLKQKINNIIFPWEGSFFYMQLKAWWEIESKEWTITMREEENTRFVG